MTLLFETSDGPSRRENKIDPQSSVNFRVLRYVIRYFSVPTCRFVYGQVIKFDIFKSAVSCVFRRKGIQAFLLQVIYDYRGKVDAFLVYCD